MVEHASFHPDGSIAAADIVFRADDVPPAGYRTFTLDDSPAGAWAAVTAPPVIENEFLRVTVDPARGGCVTALDDVRSGLSYLQPDSAGSRSKPQLECQSGRSWVKETSRLRSCWPEMCRAMPVTGSIRLENCQ